MDEQELKELQEMVGQMQQQLMEYRLTTQILEEELSEAMNQKIELRRQVYMLRMQLEQKEEQENGT